MRPHRTTIRLLIYMLFYAACCTYQQGPAFAAYSGLVVRILGGDTLEVLHNHQPKRIRLSEIDCPEKGRFIACP
jgi:endonuclease YncB( thermonuclease family)